MKNQKVLLIILAIVVVVGGVWFVVRDKDNVENDVVIEDNDNEKEEASSNDNAEDGNPTDESTDEGTEPSVDESTDAKSPPKHKEPVSDIVAGALAPDFTLETLDGEMVSLSDYQGKIVLLNFWATWCGYCVQEMPDLDRLNKEYEDVVVLAVDVMEEEGKVREYIEDGGYDFDVALDFEGEVAKTYLVSAFPTSYFIETDGTLIGRVAGMLEYEQMVEVIKKIKEDR